MIVRAGNLLHMVEWAFFSDFQQFAHDENVCVLVKLPMMNPNPILPSVDLEGLGVLRKVQLLIAKKEHAEGQVAVIDICATKLALASPPSSME